MKRKDSQKRGEGWVRARKEKTRVGEKAKIG